MTAKVLKHKFASAVADGADATIVRPSNWNDDHNLFLGSRSVTGTTDTLLAADNVSLVKYNNAAAIAATLPQATGSGGNFPLGWMTFLRNSGVGVVTVTPTTSTINGGSNIALAQNQGAMIFSDGTNYDAIYCTLAAGGNVIAVGTPANGQLAQWTDATHIQGIAASSLGFQTADSDLDTLAALGNWKVVYSNGSSNVVALSLGAANTALISNGASAAPSFAAVLMPNVTATISVGFTFTANNLGTISSGTVTPNPALGNYQYYTNNGAHTINPPTSDCAIDILVTNGASAGAISWGAGWSYSASNIGDAFTTTNAHRFIISIRRINGIATQVVKALQ